MTKLEVTKNNKTQSFKMNSVHAARMKAMLEIELAQSAKAIISNKRFLQVLTIDVLQGEDFKDFAIYYKRAFVMPIVTTVRFMNIYDLMNCTFWSRRNDGSN